MKNLIRKTMLGLTLAAGPWFVFADLSNDIVVNLEEPVDSSTYSGVSNVRGWALSPAGMGRIELFLDGVYLRDIPMGGSRLDVCRHPSYPETSYPGACESGFATSFAYSNRSAGGHRVRIVAHDLAGDHNEAIAEFATVRFDDPYISDPTKIDLSSNSGMSIVDGNTLLLSDVDVDGSLVDITLRWRTESQDFDIQGVEYPQQGSSAYVFETLNTNAVLGGQDGWYDQPGQGQAWVTTDTSMVNGTKVAAHLQTTAFNESAYLSRENDSSYSFPALTPTQTTLLMQFDLTGDYLAQFGLGHDINSNHVLEADPEGDGSGSELGPVFGIDDRRFVIQQAGLGARTYANFGAGNAGGDWYRLKLQVDLAANGGDGAGTLYYMNLSRGETSFKAVSELQNINLGLTAMHPDAVPDEWDSMWLHLLTGGGNSPSVDNLLPNTLY